MTRDEVEKRLAGIRLALEDANSRVADLLRGFCAAHGYPTIGRIKTADSIAEKIETGRFSRWSDIDDLVAFSIIIPSLDHEAAVLGYLDSVFTRHGLKKRGQANKSPDSFRFDSTRFTGRIKPNAASDLRDPLYSLLFEVQVRTAFEHAWSVSTHKAVYKPESVDWRRLRLAANLKASVEQLDAMVVGFEKMSEGIETSFWPEVDAQSKVVLFFSDLKERGVIDSVSMPTSMGRLSESVVSLIKKARNPRFSDLVKEVEGALKIIEVDVSSGAKCPRSLSVFQWFFAVLFREGYLVSLPQNYPAPVEESVSLVLGSTKYTGSVFDWNS
jgi:ppGpp synthetase/RelA/SpoT-type nucleotidyltranferase